MAYISSSKYFWNGIFQRGNFDDYISRSRDWKSDSTLCKQVMWLPKKEILMAYISNSKMLLAKITKKGNYQKRKLYARKFGKMPEKS